jgi:Flp pilus assembly protein TadD
LARPGGDFRSQPPANYIFWLGAGFSKTAGIPLAEEVVDRLLDKRWRPGAPDGSKLQAYGRLSEKEQRQRQTIVREWAQQQLFPSSPVTDWGTMYGQCLHLLPGEVDRQEFIIECIEEGRGRLNMAHLLLGQLIKTGFVETVLTTNFDDLLLRALQLYFVVPSALDPDSTNILLTNSKFVQVAYLHGRLASYRQRHTLSEVNSSIRGFETYLAQALQDHGLVIIGYRGGDETPIRLLHKVLTERGTGPGRGLFWVTRGSDAKELPETVREILALKDCYWLPAWDADEFMKKLCAWPGIGVGTPNPAEWGKGLDEMLPDEAREPWNLGRTEAMSLREKDAGPIAITKATQPSDVPAPSWLSKATDFWLADKPAEALKILQKERPQSEKLLDGLELWCRVFYDLNRKEEALPYAQKAAESFPENPAAHELLAVVLEWLRKHDEAANELRVAIDLGGSPNLNRELGLALNMAGRPQEAIGPLEAAIEVLSDKRERVSALTWLGMSLHDLGKHEEAIEKFELAERTAPLDGASYLFWSHALDALGRHDEALSKMERYQEFERKEKNRRRAKK